MIHCIAAFGVVGLEIETKCNQTSETVKANGEMSVRQGRAHTFWGAGAQTKKKKGHPSHNYLHYYHSLYSLPFKINTSLHKTEKDCSLNK